VPARCALRICCGRQTVDQALRPAGRAFGGWPTCSTVYLGPTCNSSKEEAGLQQATQGYGRDPMGPRSQLRGGRGRPWSAAAAATGSRLTVQA
jgi:hypothetical protein